jgi:hypothetical protein
LIGVKRCWDDTAFEGDRERVQRWFPAHRPPGPSLSCRVQRPGDQGSNLPFSEWGSVFPDPRLVAAIVDRITFNAHILETGTESYRLRTSKTTTRRKRAS